MLHTYSMCCVVSVGSLTIINLFIKCLVCLSSGFLFKAVEYAYTVPSGPRGSPGRCCFPTEMITDRPPVLPQYESIVVLINLYLYTTVYSICAGI
jgi:hypothetical protein